MGQKVVRFLDDTQFESEGRGLGPWFLKDEEHTFDPDFAERWIRRGRAVLVRELPDEPFDAEGALALAEEAQGIVDYLRAATDELKRAILHATE